MSDLLELYLQLEHLCGENQYHSSTCGGLRDTERRLRLTEPPHYLVVSLVRFVFDRRTGARRKLLAPVSSPSGSSCPSTERVWCQYRLYSVIVHAGHSLNAGHYFAFCRGSDGAEGWRRLDDPTVSATAPLPAWKELPAALRAAASAQMT